MSDLQQHPQRLLLDGSGYLFRAFHALPQLTGPQGQPTGAIHGMLSMLHQVITTFTDAQILVVFDSKGKTFRHDIYPEYKANRGQMPADLAVQIPQIQSIIRAWGYPQYQCPGIEADDIIGTLANRWADQGYRVGVLSTDKDMAQLVNDRIIMIHAMHFQQLDWQGIYDKYGVYPDQIIDFLALMGDSSDHIPGVPKVGSKTASKWLGMYQNIDQLLLHADEIKGKVGESLRNHIDQLVLSRQLTRIDTQIDLPDIETLDDITPNETHHALLHDLCMQLGLKRFAALLKLQPSHLQTSSSPSKVSMSDTRSDQGDNHRQNALPDHDDNVQVILPYDHAITQQADLHVWLKAATSSRYISLCIIKKEHIDHISWFMGLSYQAHKAIVLPLAETQGDAYWSIDQIKNHLHTLFADPNRMIIGHDLTQDLGYLISWGFDMQGQYHDIKQMAYVLDHQQDLSLPGLVKAYLNMQMTTKVDACLDDRSDEQLLDAYRADTGQMADMILRCYEHLEQALKSVAYGDVYWQIDQPLIRIVMAMMIKGMAFDLNKLKTLSIEFDKQIKDLDAQIIDMAGMSFNVASPKQLVTVLFDHMGLAVTKKTPKGQPSTSEEALLALKAIHPIADKILQHRHLSKLKNTYIDKWPLSIGSDGRVHTQFHLTATSTGRLSSSQPNLQNIPIKGPQGQAIRQTFSAQPGYQLVAFDYSQIELRLLAHVAQDPVLIDAFKQGVDLHAQTAAWVFDLPLDQVNLDHRRQAKAVNFGLIYGMSAFGLSKQLSVSRHQASQMIERYFQVFPGIKAYIEATQSLAQKQGFVETVWGRRIQLPGLHGGHQQRQAALRQAVNGPLQGTAADIIRLAMITCQQYLDDIGRSAGFLVLQIHDELIFEIQSPMIDELSNKLSTAMATVATDHLSVPLSVNIKVLTSDA